MAIGTEVKTKIASISSTQKITSAMEMVAASKMRRAQDRMAVGKPYAQRIRDVIGHIANSVSEYRHQYMDQREVKRVAYIVISTDRGLCGGHNARRDRRPPLCGRSALLAHRHRRPTSPQQDLTHQQ